jgi:hypothetical protein
LQVLLLLRLLLLSLAPTHCCCPVVAAACVGDQGHACWQVLLLAGNSSPLVAYLADALQEQQQLRLPLALTRCPAPAAVAAASWGGRAYGELCQQLLIVLSLFAAALVAARAA